MPTPMADILEQLDLSLDGHVRWGERVRSQKPVIYFVSLSADPSLNLSVPGQAPISLGAVEGWMEKVPSFTLSGVVQPPLRDVVEFLEGFWLPDENILYIGKATRLGKRIGQLHRHQIGNPGPHASGHWLSVYRELAQGPG